MKTADQFHPGDEGSSGYGDASGIGTDAVTESAVPGGEVGGGQPPQDESAFDESPSADEPSAGDTDVYANSGLDVDPDSAASDGEDG